MVRSSQQNQRTLDLKRHLPQRATYEKDSAFHAAEDGDLGSPR